MVTGGGVVPYIYIYNVYMRDVMSRQPSFFDPGKDLMSWRENIFLPVLFKPKGSFIQFVRLQLFLVPKLCKGLLANLGKNFVRNWSVVSSKNRFGLVYTILVSY